MHTGILTDLDFEADGRSATFLSIPYSIDRSPYFQVKIPVFRFRNGAGPRLLLMAGNHGDEYEGVFALGHILRALETNLIRGAVTILPMSNIHAVMGARRRSPLDNGNLNRAFPGDPAGTPTERLAHYLEHALFPQHDVVFDIHSGGTSMEHLTTALIERQPTPEMMDKARDLLEHLGQDYAFIAENGYDSPTSMGAAARAGAIGISGEFGGGATVTPVTMENTKRAIDNLLVRLGITQAPLISESKAPVSTTILALQSHDQAIYATRRGWFEPVVTLGQTVAAGDVAGYYHDLERLECQADALMFRRGGIVISRRLHADCQAGDCLIQAAAEIES
ncbi:succinylglutamate desuccinylase/aspartoacylase family protein [Chelativorans sp. AA-79]|uniref:succinylglutamate desuccinylase/aspartoacylase family protein n=1 Tax=Chelativorans sp. AA-79 TaxID=3028735 RepID=UPI0023F7BAF3|nr:succinylglutamate desuccinylase/aspartoacylase family protein [Chelativorans sp. AA-79]WEX10897.1 succinylglutamate desuccinylase/aspartoacylase family protein [Chelativorans sp. AA-79]